MTEQYLVRVYNAEPELRMPIVEIYRGFELKLENKIETIPTSSLDKKVLRSISENVSILFIKPEMKEIREKITI